MHDSLAKWRTMYCAKVADSKNLQAEVSNDFQQSSLRTEVPDDSSQCCPVISESNNDEEIHMEIHSLCHRVETVITNMMSTQEEANKLEDSFIALEKKTHEIQKAIELYKTTSIANVAEAASAGLTHRQELQISVSPKCEEDLNIRLRKISEGKRLVLEYHSSMHTEKVSAIAQEIIIPETIKFNLELNASAFVVREHQKFELSDVDNKAQEFSKDAISQVIQVGANSPKSLGIGDTSSSGHILGKAADTFRGGTSCNFLFF